MTTLRRPDYHNKMENPFFQLFLCYEVTPILVQGQKLINIPRSSQDVGNARAPWLDCNTLMKIRSF
jgi:hypothetical protein